MPKLVYWKKCCGCAACVNKCLKGAITMQPNHEGFLHPIVDAEKCIECKLCEKVCPGLAPATNEGAKRSTFVMQNRDDRIRYESTSGGAFSAIATEIIRQGGVVFGAVMTEGLKVVHDSVDTIEGLAKFRNSKYVQSEIGDTYLQAKKLLDAGRWVCFSGTPCQINGLHKYLGKDYERLLTVDVVCKSVPSPMIFEKYVEYKRGQEGAISDIVFRDKKRGFLYCTMAHKRQKGQDCYRRGSESDEWLRLFLSGKISRRSCMACPYQTAQRVSDITLGDIWETGNSSLDDNKGTTLVHAWTEKGRVILKAISGNVRMVEYQGDVKRSFEREHTIKLPPVRDALFRDAHEMTANAFFAKYAPNSFKIKLKEWGRFALWRLRLQNQVRQLKNKYKKK